MIPKTDPPLLKGRTSIRRIGKMNFSEADKAIDKLAREFVKRLPEDFQRIEAAFAALEAKPEDTARRTVLFRLVHDLKGQAGTFDFSLITIIGNDMCRFLEKPVALNPSALMVLRFHIDAMKWVAEKRITGDGDEHGQRMIDTLHGMTRRVLEEKALSGHGYF